MDKINNLRDLRKLRGLTQAELSMQANIRQGNLSQLERGKRSIGKLTFEVGQRLAVALGVSSDFLLSLDVRREENSRMSHSMP